MGNNSIVDAYFINCREIIVKYPELASKIVRYKVFVREDGTLVGSNRSINFIAENTFGPLRIYGLKDGEKFVSGKPTLIIEGLGYELVNLETTYLGYLSYSGAVSEMASIVREADGVPIIDMSARHYPWQIIEEVSLAAYLGGAAGTSTKAGHEYVQRFYGPGDKFKLYASLPHAMAAVVAQMAEREGLFPSVMAAKLFHEIFPDRPITVLVDYEGRELDVAQQAFEVFGEKLFAVRLDTHGGRQHQGVSDLQVFLDSGLKNAVHEYFKDYSGKTLPELIATISERFPYIPDASKYFIGNGVTVSANYMMREFLDEIGAHNVKIVVSSGFTKEKVAAFTLAKAPMDFIGTGSWVRFASFTSDISHVLEDGIWVYRAKVGRDHSAEDKLPLLFERK
jgi:nicotinate phosphoribosyltransferase